MMSEQVSLPAKVTLSTMSHPTDVRPESEQVSQPEAKMLSQAATSPPGHDSHPGLPFQIPLPRWASYVKHRASSSSMGLTKSRYMKAMKCLRRLACEILDLSLPSHDQDPAKWESFLSRLCADEPIFLNYERLWPVGLYFDEWISDPRRIPSQSDHTNRAGGFLSTHTIGTYDTVMVHVRGRRHDPVSSTASHSGHACESSRFGEGYKSKPRASFGKTSRTTSASTASRAADSDAEDFRYLLQALKPRIDDLLPNFVRNGVRDLDALRTVATFPPSMFGIFAREDLGLNPFEVHKVTLALRSLTGE